MLRIVARSCVALATLATVLVGLAPAAPAAGCPGGEDPCVYLPAGSYHCYNTYLNLPGFAVTSAPTSVITLNVPGEGVGLSGTTPTLYLGVPDPTWTSQFRLGLTLTVSGTGFLLYDQQFSPRVTCSEYDISWLSSDVSGTVGACYFTITVSL